jgi:hypothetical protein
MKSGDINEIFKKCLGQIKSLDSRESNTSRPVELEILFRESKDRYISTLHKLIEKQLDLYLNCRKKLSVGLV